MSVTIALVTAGASMLLLAVAHSARSSAAAPVTEPFTPLDEAERILTARYAAGLISPAEYRRALSMLRT